LEEVGARGSLADIVDNPKKVKLLEVEGPQLVRAIDDVELAQGYPAHLVAAGSVSLCDMSIRTRENIRSNLLNG
jgi:D-methionine transport system substrate-binding protein